MQKRQKGQRLPEKMMHQLKILNLTRKDLTEDMIPVDDSKEEEEKDVSVAFIPIEK